jgi:hypothetical protein
VLHTPSFEGCLRQPHAKDSDALLQGRRYTYELLSVGRCAALSRLPPPPQHQMSEWTQQKRKGNWPPLQNSTSSAVSGDLTAQTALDVLLRFMSPFHWPVPPRIRAVRGAAAGRIGPCHHLS